MVRIAAALAVAAALSVAGCGSKQETLIGESSPEPTAASATTSTPRTTTSASTAGSQEGFESGIPDDYLFEEGTELVAEFPFADGSVALIRYELDQYFGFELVDFHTAGPGNSSFGGPGELWAGCYWYSFNDSGYGAVLVADETWTVSVDGLDLEVLLAFDVGVAFYEGSQSGNPQPEIVIRDQDNNRRCQGPTGPPITANTDQAEDVDGFQVPDDWTVPPPLSVEELAANPLLQDMRPWNSVGPGAEYSIQIGVSRYRLVDDAGVPVPSGDAQFVDRTMTVWAMHGSVEPVVYWVGATRSFDHPEFGFSTTCDQALGFLFPAETEGAFRFSGEGDPGIYEQRFFFGDSGCETDDLSILPFLNAEFSIEIQEDRSLRIIADTDAVWLMEWIPIED